MPYSSFRRGTSPAGLPVYDLFEDDGETPALTLPQGGAADRFVGTIPERDDLRLAQAAPPGAPTARADVPPPMAPAPAPATTAGDTRPPPAPPIARGAPAPAPAAPRTDRSGAMFDTLGKLNRKDLTATTSTSEKDTNVTLEGKAIDPALLEEERALRLGLARAELRGIDERERGAALAAYLEPKRAAAVDELTAQTGAFRQQGEARRLEALQQIGKEIEEENKNSDFWGSRTEDQTLRAILGGIVAVFASPEVAANHFEGLYAKWQEKKARKLASLDKRKGMTDEYWNLYAQQVNAFEQQQLDRINKQIAGVASRGLPPKERAEFAAWFQRNRENPGAAVAPSAVAAVRQETEKKIQALSAKKTLTAKDKAEMARLQGDARALAGMEAKVAAQTKEKAVVKDVTGAPVDTSAFRAPAAAAPQAPGGLRPAPSAGPMRPTAPAPTPAARSAAPVPPEVLRQLQEEDRKVRAAMPQGQITKDIR